MIEYKCYYNGPFTLFLVFFNTKIDKFVLNILKVLIIDTLKQFTVRQKASPTQFHFFLYKNFLSMSFILNLRIKSQAGERNLEISLQTQPHLQNQLPIVQFSFEDSSRMRERCQLAFFIIFGLVTITRKISFVY